MARTDALPPDRLFTRCDPAQFDFETTQSLPDPPEVFGQQRAIDALRLGLEIAGRGYNLFVLGPPGSSRHTAVRRLLEAHAATRPPPPDWCYINNFDDGNKPRALQLPPGEGRRLQAAMQGFAAELGKAIIAALESDEYRSRLDAIQADAKQREEGSLVALGRRAAEQGIALLRTPQGFAFAPMKDDAPMPPDQFQALPEAERERIAQAIETLGEQLQKLLHDLPRLRREMQTRIREATRDAMHSAAGHLIDELREQFAAHDAVQRFLGEVLRDVVEAGEQLREQHGDDEDGSALSGSLSLLRYQVNLLVEHAADGHAPVLASDNPTYSNLVGRVDHLAHLGTLLTNFTLVKAGALHQANGGYLMLDALKVLSEPYAWAGLKRALKAGEIRIESLPQMLGFASTLPLEPEPVPLAAKVVLFGDRVHYYLLQELDPEFDELFKIAADFEDVVARDAANLAGFARLLGAMARTQRLRPLQRDAVARAAEYASRAADDASKLSTRTRALNDLLHEADAQAARAGRETIAREDVVQALAARVRRLDRQRDVLHEAVQRGTLHVATEGEQVAQVNGLAVTELGDFRFALPVRVTATARLGDGDLVDIEREATLGGPIHSKAVLILASFLGARYARERPLSLSASLVFEQSYGPIEGDSASLAELCALLSALADVPLRQSLAVTGSVDQFGRVQAVGGVNEKIEGFFDVCRARGLRGDQGVLIPAANVGHLMLREDVVAAAAEGRFRVHAVHDVDEAVALLTGLEAGRPDAKGELPKDSLNARVSARLARLSLLRQAQAAPPQARGVAARRAARGANREAR